MAAQMNYSYDTPKGVPGGKFGIGFDEVVTRMNEETDGVLKFGMGVVVGTDAGTTIKKPAAASDVFEGVAVCSANTEQDMDGKVHIAEGHSVPVMKRGMIWARLADSTAPAYGAAAYLVASGDDAGAFTATKSASTIDAGVTFGADCDVDNGIATIVLK